MITEVKTKNLIVKSKLPGTDFVINPYIGCIHNCRYCYAEYMKRFHNIDEEWGSFVFRKNWEENLQKKIQKINGASVLFGSVTDSYQPVEKNIGLMRKILPYFINTDCQVGILTKSSLVLRDIDLLKQIREVGVGVSLCSTNNDFLKLVEGNTPTSEERLDILRQLKDNKIYNYLFISPIFPMISEVKELIKQASLVTNEVYFSNLNLRGANKKRILNIIKEHYPQHFEVYKRMYIENDTQWYWNKLKLKIENECKELGIKYKIFFH